MVLSPHHVDLHAHRDPRLPSSIVGRVTCRHSSCPNGCLHMYEMPDCWTEIHGSGGEDGISAGATVAVRRVLSNRAEAGVILQPGDPSGASKRKRGRQQASFTVLSKVGDHELSENVLHFGRHLDAS